MGLPARGRPKPVVESASSCLRSAASCARRVSFSRVSATTRRRSAGASSPSCSSADSTSASRLAICSSSASSKSISAASGFGARGLRLDSRTRLAACFSSSLPPAAAARCSSSGRSATAAAALIEITPAFTASTTSAAAWAWMRSIMPTWLVLSLASRASSARLIFGAGSHGGLSSPASSTTSAVPSLSRCSCACSICLRAARMSRLRSASTPRWKSDTLRRPRCCSIIHRCTSSMLWKRVFCTVLNGRPCFWQIPKRLWPSTSTSPHSTSASRQPSARMLRSSASCSSAVSGSM